MIKLTAFNTSESYWDDNNSVFQVTGNNNALTIGYTPNTMAFIYGFGDSVCAQADTKVSITDWGRGLTVIDSASKLIDVYDSQYDRTASLRVTRSLTAPVVAPDGHGGTMVSCSTGQVDFVKNPVFQAAQVHWG